MILDAVPQPQDCPGPTRMCTSRARPPQDGVRTPVLGAVQTELEIRAVSPALPYLQFFQNLPPCSRHASLRSAGLGFPQPFCW